MRGRVGVTSSQRRFRSRLSETFKSLFTLLLTATSTTKCLSIVVADMVALELLSSPDREIKSTKKEKEAIQEYENYGTKFKQ